MSATSPPAASPSFFAKVFRVVASFGFATIILVLLLIITYLGTLEQVEHGLFESQKKYFDGLFVPNIDLACCLRAMHLPYSGTLTLPLPLPGATLLMMLLFINMVAGGIIRIRKGLRNIGVIIAHFAILWMLVAGFASYVWKKDGNLALFEGQTADEFQSYHDSVIEIERIEPAPKDGKRSALVIDGSMYKDLTSGKARTFTNKDLPFDLTVINYEVNCEPKRATAEQKWAADGYFLQRVEPRQEAEANLDGAYVKITDKKTKEEQSGLIWRAAAAPLSFKVGDDTYIVDLTRRRWKLPFAIRLDKFEREVHPGTDRARKFTSRATKITNGHEEKRVITMNAPVRDTGYVLFQASFSQDRGANGPMRSVFAVVWNPADKWPEYACYLAAFGLLLHLIIRAVMFARRGGGLTPPKASVTPA